MKKVQLSNGLVVEGTAEQIKKVADAFGLKNPLGPTYKSETHGEMLISDMLDSHLRNAMLKNVREWVSGGNLSRVSDDMLIAGLKDFPFIDAETSNLYAEFKRRYTARQTNSVTTQDFNAVIRQKLTW